MITKIYSAAAPTRFMTIKEIKDCFFHESILSASPYFQDNDNVAVAIYNDRSKWFNISRPRTLLLLLYSDVIWVSQNGTSSVYALSLSPGTGRSIRSMGFHEITE